MAYSLHNVMLYCAYAHTHTHTHTHAHAHLQISKKKGNPVTCYMIIYAFLSYS